MKHLWLEEMSKGCLLLRESTDQPESGAEVQVRQRTMSLNNQECHLDPQCSQKQIPGGGVLGGTETGFLSSDTRRWLKQC